MKKLLNYINQCLNNSDRLDLEKLNYQEKVNWRYLIYPSGSLIPASLFTFLKLPLPVLRLLFNHMYYLDNHISRLLFLIIKKNHPNKLFLNSFPVLFDLATGKLDFKF
jgi:hypothetical protein